MSALAAVALVAGVLVGLTSIGGVLLVPALTELEGLAVERAVAASLLACLLAGAVAAFVHLRRTRLDAALLAVLCAAAGLGAAAGAAALGAVPAAAVRLLVAALAVSSGLHALLRHAPHAHGTRLPGKPAMGLLGFVVGAGSALSGTGGPVMLVPVLLALGMPAAPAVALGVSAQIPITLAATLVNAAGGRLDWLLGASLGALLTAGTLAGAWLAARLPARRLAQAVGLVLVATGAWYGYATLQMG